MTTLPVRTLGILAAALALAAAPATGRDAFGVKDFLSIPIMGKAAMAPDGKRVVYNRVTRDLAKNTYRRSLHLVETATGRTIRLTGKGHNDWAPFWAADGKALYFFSDRGGKTALYANHFNGTDPEQVVPPRKGGLGSPAFSPDGKWLAFLARPAKAKGFGKDPEVHTGVEDPARWPQLWLRDMASGKERQLTDGKAYVYDFDWAPDSRRLALTADPKGSSGVTEDHHLALIDLAGKVDMISDVAAHHARPRFSPDGTRLSFLRDRHIEWGYYVNVTDLFVVDLASRAFLHLTPKANFNLEGGHWTRWSPDGRHIWFTASQRAHRVLYRIPAAGGTATRVGKHEGSVVGVSLDAAGRTAALTMSDFIHPTDLFVADLVAWKPRQLTRIRESVARFGLAAPSTMAWKAPDGTQVEGFLFLPVDLPEEKKAPMVVEIHGGPSGCWNNMFSYRYLWHVFAARGWATLIPNIRGSVSYGEKFLRANLADFGGGDFSDVISGVENAIDLGSIDKDRLAISGYSYGGFMVNMAVTKTTIFKAAVSIAGGFNFLSCFGQSNSVLPEVYYDPLGSQEKLLKAFADSPVAAVHNVRTPLLLMHGKADTAVHYMQSREFFTMLQLLNRPSKLILYPGEGHGINKPSHMTHYMNAEIDWIAKYIEPQSKPTPASPKKK